MIYKKLTLLAGSLLSITMLDAALPKRALTNKCVVQKYVGVNGNIYNDGSWVAYRYTETDSGTSIYAEHRNGDLYHASINRLLAPGKSPEPKTTFLWLEALYKKQEAAASTP